MFEKKSLVDWFEERFGKRPSASDEEPESASLATKAGESPPAEPETSEAEAETVAVEAESVEEETREEAEAALPAGDAPEEAAPEEIVPSLYERLGGAPAVDAAVDIFYRKVLGDERISHFFEDVDMVKQAAKQKAFLTMAFGGPHGYTGQDMRAAHAPLKDRSWKSYSLARRLQAQHKPGATQVERGLQDSHFDAVLENLRDTLAELAVPEDLIAKVNAIAESTRRDVLGLEPAEAD